MEPARVSSAVDMRLIRILAKMALRILDTGLDGPPSESFSRVSPGQQETQDTSRDGSRGRPDGDGYEDPGTGHRSAPGAPLPLGSTDDIHSA